MRLGEREGAPKAVTLTTFGTAEVVTEAMQAGASGFVVKDLPAPEQLAAGSEPSHPATRFSPRP